jgi:U3 small nucleolar RNA-associated protein 5
VGVDRSTSGVGAALVGAAHPGAALPPPAKVAGGGGSSGVAVLGAAEGTALGARFGKRAAAAPGVDESAGLPGSAMEEDVDAAAAAGGGDSDSGGEGEGPTMGERVAALQEASIAAASGGPAAPSSAAADAFPSGPIKADSLAVLLTQALRSGDRSLLERCLAVRNEEVVNNTVRRLAPGDVAAFLRAAVARLQSSPARGEQLAAWVRAVLLHHAAFLAGGGGGAGTLGHLYQLIEARLASYQPLLALSGRLDLVLAHSKKAGAGGGIGGAGPNGPLVTLQVGPGGEIEVEDAFEAAGVGSDDDDGYSEGGSEEEGGDVDSEEDEDEEE